LFKNLCRLCIRGVAQKHLDGKCERFHRSRFLLPDEFLDIETKCAKLVFLSGGVPSPSGEAPRQQNSETRYQTAFTLEAVFCPRIALGATMIYNID